jgi:hypothetical protein
MCKERTEKMINRKLKAWLLMFVAVLFLVPVTFAEGETEKYVRDVKARIEQLGKKGAKPDARPIRPQASVHLTKNNIEEIAKSIGNNPTQRDFARYMIGPQLHYQFEYNLPSVKQKQAEFKNESIQTGSKEERERIIKLVDENGQITCHFAAVYYDWVLETLGYDKDHRGFLTFAGNPTLGIPGHIVNYFIDRNGDAWVIDHTLANAIGVNPADKMGVYLEETIPHENWQNNSKYCQVMRYEENDGKLTMKTLGDPFDFFFKRENPYILYVPVFNDENKTVTIGEGKEILTSEDVNIACAEIKEKLAFDYTVVVHSDVKQIEKWAFAFQDSITKLDLSQSQVKKISRGMCYDCENLKEVIFSEQIEDIDSHAFGYVLSKRNPKFKTNIGETTYGMKHSLLNDYLFRKAESYSNGAFGKCYQAIFGNNQLKDGIDKIKNTIKFTNENTVEIGINIDDSYREDGSNIVDSEYIQTLKEAVCIWPGCNIVLSETAEEVYLDAFENGVYGTIDCSKLGKNTTLYEFPLKHFDAKKLILPAVNYDSEIPKNENAVKEWKVYWAYTDKELLEKRIDSVRIGELVTPIYSTTYLPPNLFSKVGNLKITDLNKNIKIATKNFESDCPTLYIENLLENRGIDSIKYNENIYRACLCWVEKNNPDVYNKTKKITLKGCWELIHCIVLDDAFFVKTDKLLESAKCYFPLPEHVKTFEWDYDEDKMPPYFCCRLMPIKSESGEIHPKLTIQTPCNNKHLKFYLGDNPNISIQDNKKTKWIELEKTHGFYYDPKTKYTHITTDEIISGNKLNFIHALIAGTGQQSDICVLNKGFHSTPSESSDYNFAKTGILWKVFVIKNKLNGSDNNNNNDDDDDIATDQTQNFVFSYSYDTASECNGKRFYPQSVFLKGENSIDKKTAKDLYQAGFWFQMSQDTFNKLKQKGILSPNIGERTITTNRAITDLAPWLAKRTQ